MSRFWWYINDIQCPNIRYVTLNVFQPDQSVTPFLDSLIDNTGISDVFSIQLCGDKFEQQTDKDVELGGSIVSLIDLIILIY